VGQQIWCCLDQNRGCSEQRSSVRATTSLVEVSSATSTTSSEYNCQAGLDLWEEHWTGLQKEWCCQSAGLGCEDAPYDCEVGQARWEETWTRPKIEWCCRHVGVTCVSSRPSGEPLDCRMGSSSEQAQWSSEKSQFCCQSEGLGCSNLQAAERLFGTTQGPMQSDSVPERLGLCSMVPLAMLVAHAGLALRRRMARPRAGYAEMLADPALARGLQA